MKQNNPFAKLGAIDQKLYQETASKPDVKETEEAPTAKSQNAGMPEIQLASMLSI